MAAYEEEEEEEEALAGDEKVAMEILRKEFKWYSDVIEYMEKNFRWSEVRIKEDRILYLDLLTEMERTCGVLCDLMDSSAEIHLSNLKSLINDERANFYNYSFDFSHKISDLALKGHLASFQPSSAKNSLPFPDSDSDSDSKEDKDGKTLSENSCISSNTDTLSPPSKNSSISSNTELPEMITRKRKRSHGEEEEESSGTFYLEPPIFHVDLPRPYGVYHDHSHDRCGLNYRYAEDDDDYFEF